MGCFPCFGSEEEEANNSNGVKNVSKKESFREDLPAQSNRVNSDKSKSPNRNDSEKDSTIPKDPITHIATQTFTFRELSAATKKFRHASLLGEDGFGRVYKGRLESTGKVVAVKKLDQEEFWVELEMLSNLHHENIVKLIGYCSEGDDRRFIVCEYFPLGSLQYNLHDHPPYKEPLDWNTRIKIAAGVAKGLEYLHEKTDPPVIYRDLKSSSIFLDDEFFPKLFDFNSATLHHVPSKTTMISGYCAPEFAITGQLTLKSDMYSFGVLLLELITGRKAFDNTKDTEERNLVEWAKPRLQHRRLFSKMVDPLLQGRYPAHGLYEALTLAAKCVQEQPSTRCSIGEIVTALTYLASQNYDPATSSFNGTNQ